MEVRESANFGTLPQNSLVSSTSAIPTLSTKKPNFAVNKSNADVSRDRSATFGKMTASTSDANAVSSSAANMKGTYGGLTDTSTVPSVKAPSGSRPNIGGAKAPKVKAPVPSMNLPSSAYASFDTNNSAPAPVASVTPDGIDRNGRKLVNKKSTDSINIVEEEISDENSVKAGSYRKSALDKSNTDRNNMTTEEVLPSASERTGRLDVPNVGYKINKKEKDYDDDSRSRASKYSAVPFTKPIEFEAKAPRDEAEEDESEDDYEDDFEDDFEPYETSHEEAAKITSENEQ